MGAPVPPQNVRKRKRLHPAAALVLGTALLLFHAFRACEPRVPPELVGTTASASGTAALSAARSPHTNPGIGSLLEPARRTDGTFPPEACASGAARTFVITGDPTTRIVDTVWRRNDCLAEISEPVPRLAVAMRLIDTALVDGHVYARVESVAYRGQPAGMRTWIDLDNGLPTASNAPLDRTAALAMLPPVSVGEMAAFSTEPRPGRKGAVTWHDPSGIAVEDVYQQTFRRERSRLVPDDPRFASVRDKLASARSPCARGWSLPPTVGRCWGGIAGFDDVAFVAPAGEPEGPPLVRAVGRKLDGRQVLGAVPPPLDESGHRQVIEAYLARQPLTGTLVAVGPLNANGGSSGVFFSPEPVPRIFVVVVDGAAGSIHVDGPLDGLHRKGLVATSEVRAAVLGPTGASGYFGSALIWFARADETPWAGVVTFAHPYASPKGPGFGNHEVLLDGAYASALSSARTFAEARAAVASVPPRPTP